jgi:hypothetical protein
MKFLELAKFITIMSPVLLISCKLFNRSLIYSFVPSNFDIKIANNDFLFLRGLCNGYVMAM